VWNVKNRVKEINTYMKIEHWHHVLGLLNPTDLPSKECSPTFLVHPRWREGPPWLKGPKHSWPSQEEDSDEEEVSAEKSKSEVKVSLVSMDSELPLYRKRSSSYVTNVRICAWVLKFIQNLKDKKRCGEFSSQDVDNAEKVLFKQVQKECFPSSGPAIKGLRVEQDVDGILRVKTKIVNFPESEDTFRRPVLLPNSHLLVEKLIRQEHASLKHAGTQILMSKLREKVWICKSRQAIKKVIGKLATCRSFTAKRMESLSAPLLMYRKSVLKCSKLLEWTWQGHCTIRTEVKHGWFCLPVLCTGPFIWSSSNRCQLRSFCWVFIVLSVDEVVL